MHQLQVLTAENNLQKIIQRLGFAFRFKLFNSFFSYTRRFWFSFLGMKIGKATHLPKLYITWPHQLSIGKNCNLERNINFKYDGPWLPGPRIIIGNTIFIGTNCEFNINEGITIGDDSLIASGCKFIDHDHGIDIGEPMYKQYGSRARIAVGSDVWLGCNVIVLKGVTIEDGAIVAAGAVVTKSIPAFEIWGGVPAKKIGQRS